MTARGWILFAAVAGGALLLLRRKRADADEREDDSAASSLLGSPVEASGTPRATPHGYYGAPRSGPPVHTHQGVDLVAPAGSHVLAVGDGLIVRANPGIGKTVRKLQLDRASRWDAGDGPLVAYVVYADLGAPLIAPGDRVRRGDPIALVDKAGFVHFAVKKLVHGQEQFFDSAEAGFRYRKPTKEVTT